MKTWTAGISSHCLPRSIFYSGGHSGDTAGVRFADGGGGPVEVTHPFLYHKRPAVLSVRVKAVLSWRPNNYDMHVWFNMLTVRFRLLFITLHLWFIHKTR